ncbi:MAG: LLM class flavin-dependent oxidoreductase [Candidatus Thorarchaeota archaeon]|jgi:alkanesulfonate monooxygenase SsuD/methylene tetrahydromethanopterin reductase-like flavin-dependent oxidoreductase (luciferase family)|nr:LLM class flavin-dependent oxidoreductase [Candidatus Bathyarchaeota archaeon]
MKYGINIPNFGWFGDIDTLVDIAIEAEDAGWDGFFLWDHMLVFKQEDMVLPFADPWIAMAAIACKTKRIQFGPLIVPLPRRRPWKVAREAITVDHLSKGRLILGVGIGAPPDVEFEYFGEESSERIRAEMLDESLEIITSLWSGEKFSFKGKHYQLEEMTFLPKPTRDTGIPIWVGGGFPHKAPFRRAARYDGVSPVHSNWPDLLMPDHLKQVLGIVEAERGNLNDYDIVVCGDTTGTDSTSDRETIESWADAGATWWQENINGMRAEIDELRERVRRGPPSM